MGVPSCALSALIVITGRRGDSCLQTFACLQIIPSSHLPVYPCSGGQLGTVCGVQKSHESSPGAPSPLPTLSLQCAGTHYKRKNEHHPEHPPSKRRDFPSPSALRDDLQVFGVRHSAYTGVTVLGMVSPEELLILPH